MAEDKSSGAQLVKVFAWVLAALIGGIAWLALSIAWQAQSNNIAVRLDTSTANDVKTVPWRR
jgi:hypothetical protein